MAGPYIVTRLPHHRPIWECAKLVAADFLTQAHIGHYNTAADAKQAAADDYASTTPAWVQAVNDIDPKGTA